MAVALFAACASVARADLNDDFMTVICGGPPEHTGTGATDSWGYACAGCPRGSRPPRKDERLSLWSSIEGHFTSNLPQRAATLVGCGEWEEARLALVTETSVGWRLDSEIPQTGSHCIKVAVPGKQDGLVCHFLSNDGSIAREGFELLTFADGRVTRKPFLVGFWHSAIHGVETPADCSEAILNSFPNADPRNAAEFYVTAMRREPAGTANPCEGSRSSSAEEFHLGYRFDGQDVHVSDKSASVVKRLRRLLIERTPPKR